MKKLSGLWVFLGVLLLAATAWAATQNAVVYGTVYDTAGNPMPGVSVMLENAALGFSRTAITGSDGSYNFAEVPPADDYKLTATKDGKTLDIRAGIAVNVGDERVILPPLKEQAAAAAGGQAQPRVVTGQAVSNDTVSTTISGVITGDQLRSLPLYNRNFLILGMLTPNVRDTEPGSELAGASFSIAGNRPSSNNFLLDGADNVASSSNQAVPFVVNDSVQEFRVVSSTASAEFGRAGGGVVNIVTRRGGNAWHGSAFGYFGMDSLNADSPLSVYNGSTFDQGAAYAGSPATTGLAGFPLYYNQFVSGAELSGFCTDSLSAFTGVAGSVACANGGTGENTRFDPDAVRAANDRFDRPFSAQQFGVNLGGAVIRDKWFGFVSYEGTRIDNPNPVFERVPTTFDRTYDPLGTGNFLFGPADPNYILAQNVLSLFPSEATHPGSIVTAVPDVLEFFQGEAPNYTNVHNLVLRSDFTASDHDSWTVRYVGQKLDQLHDATLPATGSYPGNGAFRDALNQNLVISYSRTFSPTVINEFRVGFNRFNVEEKAQDRTFDAGVLGFGRSEMPTFFLNGIDPQSSGQRPDTDGILNNESGAFSLWIDCCGQFPTLDYLFPFGRLGAPLGAPTERRDTTLFAADNLSVSIGKHSLKLGGEFRHLRNDLLNNAFRRGFVYSSNIGEFTSNSEDCNEACLIDFGGFQFSGPGTAFSAPSFDFAQFVPDPYEGRFRSWVTAGYF
ncbi:MAG: carboxypeptidase regulatory-like domain-containing protein, partial [Terriglobales bacterium]